MRGLFEQPAPRWFTIEPHRPFVADLARAIWDEFGGDPAALSAATILLPTRRAGRALAEALVDCAGEGAALLPQIRALGDLDEDEPPFEAPGLAPDLPPALSPAQRRYELAGLAAGHAELLGRKLTAAGALEMADALAAFLDAREIEERTDPADLMTLADEAFARHWQISAQFLSEAAAGYAQRLESLGAMDPTARRVALTRALADAWRDRPPTAPVIAAGSTGSSPAAADLLCAIAAAPRGLVVLPGLDRDLAEAAWAEVSDGHPQGAMKRLLARAGVARGEVAVLSPAEAGDAAGRWRRRVINEALRPAEATADWLSVIERLAQESADPLQNPVARGLEGLQLLETAHEDEAATLIALLMREALETPDRTCALVTPDAALAERVSARLTRWGVVADVSAGASLASQPGAVLATLMAEAVADPLAPVPLLALAKHPLTRAGLDERDLARGRRRLELRGLRGQRPAGWDDLFARLGEDADDPALRLTERLRCAIALARAPFEAGAAAPSAAAKALAIALETLCEGPGSAPGGVWSGAGGEALAEVFRRLIEASEALPEATAQGFCELLSGALAREVVRGSGGGHPRLRILGALEARLVRSDLTILAGLEEGVWPAGVGADPFLSRPMRERLGLPAPERRIGLSAHDFAQAACAPEVVLVVSHRRDGAPAVASRWVWRLKTLAAGAGTPLPGRPEALRWARALDAPLSDPPLALRPASRPMPRPPVAVRPRKMGVTTVERWIRDPYAVYARYVLRLRPLAPPDEPVDALLRGVAVHAAFDAFAKAWPGALPADAEARFVEILMQALSDAGMPRPRLAREAALAHNLAPWVVAFETDRRDGAVFHTEMKGALTFAAPGGPFTITAQADRLEVREGRVDILDFKTGSPPSKKQVSTHLRPQLTLTAAIAARGGFESLGPLAPRDLLYVQVSGGRTPGAVADPCDGESERLSVEALEGLRRWVSRYDDPTTPYKSWERPMSVADTGDYDHLARAWEWRVLGEGEGDGGE